MLPVEDILPDPFNAGADLSPSGHGELEGGGDPQSLAVDIDLTVTHARLAPGWQ
jgi:hypothetical protein